MSGAADRVAHVPVGKPYEGTTGAVAQLAETVKSDDPPC